MKGERIKAYVDKLIAEKGIPYIDFYMSVGKEDAFRYCASKDGKATGKEKLWLFSATKPMTVVAAMRLVEEGKLSLDDEVAKYIPAFANTFLKEVAPTKNKMTVRQLFTMSAGLTYHATGEPYKSLIQQAGEEATTLEIINALAKAPLLFEPGERFEYSLCHDVLAAVVEVASGKRFAEYMDEVIFQPLGMLNTGFHTEKKEPLAPCYFVEKGEFVERPNKNFLVFTEHYDSGGAGAISCVDDYARLAKTLALGGVGENGYRLLGEEALKQLRTCQHGNLQLQSTFTCVQGEDYGYGLGVRVRKNATEWGLPEGEFGWDGAAGTYLMVDPVNQISIVIGMHVRNWPEVFMGEHLQLVQRAYEDLQEKNPEKR
jgi:CubicO group peptidase (beta-lactamase class C family)